MQLGPIRVHRERLPSGDPGTRRTLEIMRRLTHEGATDPTVRAASIAALTNVRSHDARGEIASLFRFVRDRVAFRRDPVRTEWLQAARHTLSLAAGDCDDRAVLLAAMLRSVGIPAWFRVVALDRSRPTTFSHVYVVVKMGDQVIPLDPTYPENAVGMMPAGATRSMEVPA
jgi:transglutaminase-like putative cysteine protease